MNRLQTLIILLVVLLVASPDRLQAAASAKTLNWSEAVSLAKVENPELLAADAAVRSAENKRNAAWGTFLPQLKATVIYDESLSTPAVASATSRWSAGITGTLNLFSGWLDDAKLKQATYEAEKERATRDQTRARVSQELKTAFEAAAFSRDLRLLTSEITRRREENLKLVQLRYESGRENKGSVLLSEAYLAQARYEDLQAEHSATTAQSLLFKALGIDATNDGNSKLDVIGHVPITEPQKEAARLEAGLENKVLATPEWRQAEQLVASAESSVTIARSQLFPSLDLTAAVGRRDDAFFPTARETQSVGLTLTIPLFSGFKDISTLRSSTALAEAAKLNQDNTKREILRKLKQTLAAHLESAAKLKADESFERAAIVRSDIARTRYNNGLLSFEDWDVIENDLIARRKAVLNSRQNQVQTGAAWEQAIGQGVFSE